MENTKTTSTKATLIVPASAIDACKADFNGLVFNEYENASNELFYVTSGWFFDTELDFIANEAEWKKKLKFGEVEQILAELGLTKKQEPEIVVLDEAMQEASDV